ncbi:hypothetical protein [Kribbella qitaiheensis]|nr:hypothetical protein [Kribbella qitaiheensis]
MRPDTKAVVDEFCRYRALASNAPSVRIAEKLGFTPFGQNLVFKQQ